MHNDTPFVCKVLDVLIFGYMLLCNSLPYVLCNLFPLSLCGFFLYMNWCNFGGGVFPKSYF